MKLEKKLVFIFNPKAGKGKIKTSLMDIVDIFNKGGYEVIIRATQAPKDAYEQVKKYADKVDLIVCSGGDGTLDEVVTGITEVGSKVPVGYIPAGLTLFTCRSSGKDSAPAADSQSLPALGFRRTHHPVSMLLLPLLQL